MISQYIIYIKMQQKTYDQNFILINDIKLRKVIILIMRWQTLVSRILFTRDHDNTITNHFDKNINTTTSIKYLYTHQINDIIY